MTDLGSPYSALNLKFLHLRGKGNERHPDRARRHVYAVGMSTLIENRGRFGGSGRKLRGSAGPRLQGRWSGASCVCRNSGTHAAPRPCAPSGLEQRQAAQAAGRGGAGPGHAPSPFSLPPIARVTWARARGRGGPWLGGEGSPKARGLFGSAARREEDGREGRGLLWGGGACC